MTTEIGNDSLFVLEGPWRLPFMLRNKPIKILLLAFMLLFLYCGQAHAQAPTITSLSPTSGVVGSSVTITGTNFGSTQGGSSTVKFNGTTATPTSWSATSIVAPVPGGATTGNVVATVSSVASNGVNFTVTTLPIGLSDGDIGSVGVAGNASFANGVFTVRGAGNGVGLNGGGTGFTVDGFHFVYKAMSGDGTIVAQVVSRSSAYAEAGVMIRETLDPAAKNMFVAGFVNNIYDIYRTTS